MPADNSLKRKVASLEAETADLNAKVASLETDAADLTQLLHQCKSDSSEVEASSESDWSDMDRSGTTWSLARSSSWSEEGVQKAKMSIYCNDSADHAAVTQDNEMQYEAAVYGGGHDGPAPHRTPPPSVSGTQVTSPSCMLCFLYGCLELRKIVWN